MSEGGATKVVDSSDKSEYSNRVSRLRGVMGAEALAKLTSSSVLIIGLGGLGVEIAKNVILTGVKSCTLFDKSVATQADLASQFYVSEDAVGKPRADASLPHLQTLNPYTAVSVHNGEVTTEFLSQFTVVVATECSYERQIFINDYCHKNDIKFISTDVAGVFGRCFCDFGAQFTVVDTNGQAASDCVLSNIVVDADVATVTVHEEKRHGLSDGDFVTFKEIVGATQLNGCTPKQVTVVDGYSFKVSGCTGCSAYVEKGIMTQIKQPRVMEFRTFKECLKSPGELMVYDFAKFETPARVHLAFAVLDEFHKTHGNYPEPFNAAHEAEFLSIGTRLHQVAEGNTKDAELDDGTKHILTEMCRTCRGRLNPLCAVFGGYVGQEVLKACSAKFTPTHQFLYMEFCEMLPSRTAGEPFAVTCAQDVAPQGNRYDGQTAVIGHKLQAAICKQNYFLVGAGAIGCEMLKNWALMGFGAERGMIHITDMDQIERSNLSRQFLFRENHIGKLKSTSAAQAAQVMNPSLNIRAYDLAVGPDSENDFTDDFIESLDCVVTALDNVQARLYLDDRAMQFAKPFVDSGTLGAMGSVQVVVPRMTKHYGASRDPPEKSIPLCTLKRFPYRIEHTIQWAKDYFNGKFTVTPANCAQYLKTGGQFIDSMNASQKLRVLHDIRNYFTRVGAGSDALQGAYARSFDDCIAWARLRFQESFTDEIAQMVYSLPPDKLLENGTKFWSGTKRCPSPVVFDPEDPLHMAFVVSAANLHAAANGIPASQRHTDVAKVKKVAASVKIPEFKPVDGVKIATTDEEAQKEDEEVKPAAMMSLDEEVAQVKQEIDAAIVALDHVKAGIVFEPAEFEKDDDTNFHVDFMTACANLRARNYSIPEADRHKTKMTAGNIIPAIATTTALVTGLVCIELLKLLQSKKLEDYKQANINLAIPTVLQFEPDETEKMTYKEHVFTPWDNIDVQGPKTLNEFVEYLQETYSVDVSMLSYGNAMLYSFFASAKKRKARGPKLIEDVIAEVTGKAVDDSKRFLVLDPYCTDEDGEDVELPPVRYMRHVEFKP